MEIFAKTERLFLRELLPTDVDGMFELDADSEVHKYLGNKPVKNKEQTVEVINFVRRQYIENGIGRWAIVEKATNNFIGWSGLKLVKERTNNHVDYYDLGYRLIKKYWGQGFAKESALASLTYGFETLKLKEIFAVAHIENTASNAILKKIGFQKTETFTYDKALHNWYKLSQVEWKNGKATISKF